MRVEFCLIEKGDICSRCPQRPECPDQTRCLHWVAGGNNPLSSFGDDQSDFVNVPVEEIMTKKVITISPDVEALQAGATMTARRIKQLPVVLDHRIVGIISHQDIGWGLMMQYAECMKG